MKANLDEIIDTKFETKIIIESEVNVNKKYLPMTDMNNQAKPVDRV